MRTRLTVSVAFLVIAVAVGLHAQDAPPIVLPARKPVPVAPASPAPERSGPDLSRLKPLERQFHLAARRGAGRLDRMNERKGRFIEGWQTSLNLPVEGENALRQAEAAFALARSSRFLKDDDQAAHAAQAVLVLLEATTVAKGRTGSIRRPITSDTDHVSYASLLVLAIHELPKPDESLLKQAEELCAFLREQQQADGSFLMREGTAGETALRLDAEHSGLYSGQALHALARSHERCPVAWKMDVLRKALPACMKQWRENKTCGFACAHSAAYAEAFLHTTEKPFAEAVLELNDWLCGLQYDRLDPKHSNRLGGFQTVRDGKAAGGAPDIRSAACCESLAEACRVTRRLGDVVHHERFTAALERGLQFVTTLQYSEADTQHFADWYRNERLMGGFHGSHSDGDVSLDGSRQAVSALIQYLRHVALIP